MWFSYVLVVLLAILALTFVFIVCGARIRERPWLLFALGFVVAGCGVVLWWSAEELSKVSEFICPNFEPSENCVFTSRLGVMTGKLVEVGFAALGAGLMALAIDIRSKQALDAEHRRFQSKAKQLQSKLFRWRRAFEKLGDELDSIASQERVRRYRQLQDTWWDIQFDKDDLREEFGRWRLEYPDEDEKVA